MTSKVKISKPKAIEVIKQFIENGTYKNILVIGADTLTKYLDWNDRGTCILFGDGAGAVILSATKEENGIIASWLKAEGHLGDNLIMPGGGSRDPEQKHGRFITMNGKEVFKFAVRVLEESVNEVLMKAGLKTEDINLLVPHQANARIVEHVRKKMHLSEEKVFQNYIRWFH